MFTFNKSELINASSEILKMNTTVFKLKLKQAEIIKSEIERIKICNCSTAYIEVMFILVQSYCYALNRELVYQTVIDELEIVLVDIKDLDTVIEGSKEVCIERINRYIRNLRLFHTRKFQFTKEEYDFIFERYKNVCKC